MAANEQINDEPDTHPVMDTGDTPTTSYFAIDCPISEGRAACTGPHQAQAVGQASLSGPASTVAAVSASGQLVSTLCRSS